MCPWVALPLDFVQREQRHTVEEALRQLDASLRRAEKYGGSRAASGVAVCVCARGLRGRFKPCACAVVTRCVVIVAGVSCVLSGLVLRVSQAALSSSVTASPS